MKKEITGYLTAMIDTHNRGFKLLKEQKQSATLIEICKGHGEGLVTLLDFVEGFEEENPITDINLKIYRIKEKTEEIFNLRKKIKELKEANSQFEMSNKKDYEHEDKLYKKLTELQEGYEAEYQIQRDLHAEIEKLEAENKRVNGINETLFGELQEERNTKEDWQRACSELRKSNKSLEEKIKLHEQIRITRCIGRMK